LHWMPSAPTLFTLLFVVTGLLLVVKYVRTRVQLRNAEDPFEEEL